MSTLGHHIMIRCDDDRVLAPSPAARRALAQAVYRVATTFPLLCFGGADTHLHLVVLSDHADAVDLAGRLKRSLRHALGLEVGAILVRIKPLADHHHLVNAFHYVLGQRNRHGVQSDPFLDASSLPELLGIRRLATDATERVREQIARLTRERLLLHLGPTVLEPANAPILTTLSCGGHDALLRDAAAGAQGLADLSGRTPAVVAARKALVRVLAPHCDTQRLAEIIERSPSQARYLRTLPPAPALERAIGQQITLRAWVLQQESTRAANGGGTPHLHYDR